MRIFFMHAGLSRDFIQRKHALVGRQHVGRNCLLSHATFTTVRLSQRLHIAQDVDRMDSRLHQLARRRVLDPTMSSPLLRERGLEFISSGHLGFGKVGLRADGCVDGGESLLRQSRFAIGPIHRSIQGGLSLGRKERGNISILPSLPIIL